MGMIYKRKTKDKKTGESKEGKIYWIKYYRNGKPYRESTKSIKEADAKRLLKKREGEISQGKLPGIYFDRVRFDDLAEDFLRDYRINGKKSLVRAERSANHLKSEFEGMRATEITTPRIEAYIEKRMECVCKECEKTFRPQNTCPSCGNDNIKPVAAHASINRELSALKRMFNLGARRTPPKVDRVPYIPMLKENNIRKGFFEHGDFISLRTALPYYLKGFVTFAYKTGWRVSEINSLTWSQVDLEKGLARLEVGETKNNEGRTVYLDDELKNIFSQQWEFRKKTEKLIPYVFPNREGKDKIKDFRFAWDKACENAKIGKRLFHDFRRTAVRNMVRSGIPETVAMKISGHKTRSVFDRYNIVNDKDLRLAAKAQETYLQAQTGTNSGTIHKIGTKKEVRHNA